MSFALSGLMMYTMWAIFGLMFLDLLISFFRSLSSNSFSLSMFSGYLRDVLNYVFPLMIVANMMSLDPTGWIMLIAYYLGGVSVIWNYVTTIKGRF